MYIVRPTPEMEQVFFTAIQDLARGQQGSNGVIELTQQQILDRSNNVIKSFTTLSGLMNYYRQVGLIERIRKGSVDNPSIWDVSSLLSKIGNEGNEAPVADKAYEKEKAPVVEEGVVDEIKTTLTSMLSFLESLPKEIGPSIEALTNKIDVLDGGKTEELESKHKELGQVVEELRSELVVKDEDNAQLKEKVKQLEDELALQSNPAFNEHKIYRSRNYILDEIERFLSAPGWSRKGKETHLRSVVTNHLDSIMKELDIHGSTSL